MHTNTIFEFSLVLDREHFETILEKSYCGDAYLDEELDNYIDCSLAEKGIVVFYRNSQYKKKLRILANAAILMNGEEGKAHKLVRKLDKHLSEYFHDTYRLDDFNLTGATFVTDIQVGSPEKLRAYIQVFQRTGKVKKFSPVDYEGLSRSYCLEGNSNAIALMIYDLCEVIKKRTEDTRKHKTMPDYSDDTLRIEVRLKKPKAIRACTDEIITSEQVAALSEKSKEIVLSVLTRIIPYGDFYKKPDAVAMIRREIADPPLRRRMLRLVALIPEKKSLLLAQKEMHCRYIDDVMAAFQKIGLSPVTISKRQGIEHLETFYSHIIH